MQNSFCGWLNLVSHNKDLLRASWLHLISLNSCDILWGAPKCGLIVQIRSGESCLLYLAEIHVSEFCHFVLYRCPLTKLESPKSAGWSMGMRLSSCPDGCATVGTRITVRRGGIFLMQLANGKPILALPCVCQLESGKAAFSASEFFRALPSPLLRISVQPGSERARLQLHSIYRGLVQASIAPKVLK